MEQICPYCFRSDLGRSGGRSARWKGPGTPCALTGIAPAKLPFPGFRGSSGVRRRLTGSKVPAPQAEAGTGETMLPASLRALLRPPKAAKTSAVAAKQGGVYPGGGIYTELRCNKSWPSCRRRAHQGVQEEVQGDDPVVDGKL
eukprot:gene22277-biopygen17715